ncbi:hypothetical protein MAR_006888, partial [Mya arenaria]
MSNYDNFDNAIPNTTKPCQMMNQESVSSVKNFTIFFTLPKPLLWPMATTLKSPHITPTPKGPQSTILKGPPSVCFIWITIAMGTRMEIPDDITSPSKALQMRQKLKIKIPSPK